MARRIALHQAARGPGWRLVEAPLALAEAVRREAAEGRVLLVDCLTLWLSNLMQAGRDPKRETAALIAALPALPGKIVFITNEVGNGIVPDSRLARDFRDAQGRLNQEMASACTAAALVVMGLPFRLKG
jgi:adenosylcobinamide kinase / adenosylcobinamide-phosphate guanylyltransferase